ncbi:MAG: zf-HC2 domain-containing protein [Gammaproteobacteria bacterium]|nr:zf-HC2 domain-containing protein [Gammaproteobacteria bacterium]MBV9696477.1 zf-HC2 domain-containing protein [Gammaproteobacteria bacterium]
MACAESLRVQAYFDAELPPGEARALEEHLNECAACRAQLQVLGAQRARLRVASEGINASRALSTRVSAALAAAEDAGRSRQRERRTFWFGALGGALAGACAVALVFLGAQRLRPDALTQVAAQHVSALAGDALIQMRSSSHHTLKPWFAGRSDVAPVVADFSDEGYPLLGGRVQRLAGSRAAVLVYAHGAHVLEVFSWPAPAGAVPLPRTVHGYHLLAWQSGDVRSCLVGDAAWPELQRLAGLLQERARLEAVPP